MIWEMTVESRMVVFRAAYGPPLNSGWYPPYNTRVFSPTTVPAPLQTCQEDIWAYIIEFPLPATLIAATGMRNPADTSG